MRSHTVKINLIPRTYVKSQSSRVLKIILLACLGVECAWFIGRVALVGKYEAYGVRQEKELLEKEWENPRLQEIEKNTLSLSKVHDTLLSWAQMNQQIEASQVMGNNLFEDIVRLLEHQGSIRQVTLTSTATSLAQEMVIKGTIPTHSSFYSTLEAIEQRERQAVVTGNVNEEKNNNGYVYEMKLTYESMGQS